MINSSLASALSLDKHPQALNLSRSFGQGHSSYCVVIPLNSIDGEFTTRPITFSVMPKLQPLPIPSNCKEILALPSMQSLNFTDPELGGKVDMFIGNMEIDEVTFPGSIKFDSLKAIITHFEWTIVGAMSCSTTTSSLITSVDPLKDDLARLWELDQVPDTTSAAKSNEIVEEFHENYSRVESRFIVKLPNRLPPTELEQTRKLALRRFHSNEKSLTRKDKLSDFQASVSDFVSSGNAEIIPRKEFANQPHFYLPVHGVFIESSSTTKLRPVFNASARSSYGISLNARPCFYSALTDVLIRFRNHRVGMSADI